MTTNTKVKTPEGRIAFHKNLFIPNEFGKYSAALVMDKDVEGSKEFGKIKELIDETIAAKWGDKVPKNLELPMAFKVADDYGVDDNGEPEYAFLHDKYVLNAKANSVIQGSENTVDVYKKEGNNLIRLNDATEFKAGDNTQFVISAFAWVYKKRNGVSLNLDAVCKISDNDAFYQATTTDSFFGGNVVEDTATAGEDYSF